MCQNIDWGGIPFHGKAKNLLLFKVTFSVERFRSFSSAKASECCSQKNTDEKSHWSKQKPVVFTIFVLLLFFLSDFKISDTGHSCVIVYRSVSVY